jgi:hypothetical protein
MQHPMAFAHGGKEFGLNHYPVTVTIHSALLFGCVVGAWAHAGALIDRAAVGQRAFHTGRRFSANANGPSLASSDRSSVPNSRVVRAQAGSSSGMTPSSAP